MFIYIFLQFLLTVFAGDEHKSMFNLSWLKCIVSIEQLDSPTNSHPIGTGFILLSPDNHCIVVTAKHVILKDDGSLNGLLAWRLNEKTYASDLKGGQFQTTLAMTKKKRIQVANSGLGRGSTL